MIKAILIFVTLWAFVTGSISMWREISAKERWSLVKLAAYGFVTVAITFAILIGLVILF